jgi:hypothetical protein
MLSNTPKSSIRIISVGGKPNMDPFFSKFWTTQWLQSKQPQLTRILVMPLNWTCQYFGRASWGSNQTYPKIMSHLAHWRTLWRTAICYHSGVLPVSPGVGSALQRRCAMAGIDRIAPMALPLGMWRAKDPSSNRPAGAEHRAERASRTYVPFIRRDTIRIT